MARNGVGSLASELRLRAVVAGVATPYDNKLEKRT
jgi:hypothetical protein